MVPIDSPWVISYWTSIDLIVSVTSFEIFDVILMTLKKHISRSSKAKGHGANWKPIDAFIYDLHCV